MTTITHIAHCPNCKSDWVAVQKIENDDAIAFSFHCYNCFNDTPQTTSLSEAATHVEWQPIMMYQKVNTFISEF